MSRIVTIIDNPFEYHIDIDKIDGFCTNYQSFNTTIYLNGQVLFIHANNEEELLQIRKLLKGDF